MDKRPFGETGLALSPLGLGTWAMGGPGWEWSWGPQNDRDSIHTIFRALDLGINWIDTAPVYGLGHAEELVGQALASIPSRDRPYVFTKCSMIWDVKGQVSYSLTAPSVRAELEESLRRLRLEAIDLLQIHWPIPEDQVADGWSVLGELVKEGKVRHIGVCNVNVDLLERLRAHQAPESVQTPYSLLDRSGELDLLPLCQRMELPVLAYSPLQSGLLTDKANRTWIDSLPPDDWRRTSEDFQEPRLTQNLEILANVKRLAVRYETTSSTIALNWVLHRPGVAGAIVGARNVGQLQQTALALSLRLDPNDYAQLDRFSSVNSKETGPA